MEVKAFLIQFEKSLIRGGLDEASARQHTTKIANGLTEKDRAEIAKLPDGDGASRIAARYLRKIKSDSAESRQAQSKTSSSDAPKKSEAHTEIYETEDEAVKVKAASGRSFTPESEDQSYKTSKFTAAEPEGNGATRTIDRSATKAYTKIKLTPEGKKRYRKALLKKLPMLCALYISIGILSLLVYSLIAALIAVILFVLVASTVIGTVGSLAGLIYGIIKLFSVVPEGLYEIGFAIIIIGITMILCISLYNLAVRVVPILWKSFTEYIRRNVLWQIKHYLNQMRKEANRA